MRRHLTPLVHALPRGRPALAALVAITAFAITLAARWSGLLEPVELGVYDRFLRSSVIETESTSPITLITITEDDIRRFGHPIPDHRLADLIRTILGLEPRALGIDLYRDLPVPTDPMGGVPAGYEALGRTVTGDPRIFMIFKFPDEDGNETPPPKFLDGSYRAGFADVPVDADGYVRRGLLSVVDEDGNAFASFSYLLAAQYLAAEGLAPRGEETSDALILGPVSLQPMLSTHGPYAHADARGFQYLLDYAHAPKSFTTYTLSEVTDGAVAREAFADRVVILGTAAPSVKDSFLTPVSALSDRTTFGVEVHAHGADQLIRYARGASVPQTATSAIVMALGIAACSLLGSIVGLFVRSLFLQVAIASATSVLLWFGARGAFLANHWVPLTPCLLSLTLGFVAAIAVLSMLERLERRQLSSLFSRFQGRTVADEIWRRRDEFMGDDGRPVTRRVTLTALASDLEGYTTASEEMAPEALMEWINEYMREMADLVEQHGGVVIDYAGDGVMASFGFPIPSEDEEAIDADARQAVACALAMGEKMDELNADWRSRGLTTGRCRVGICTGSAVIGCIGGRGSLKYSAIGDTVNTAARLEGFGKDEFSREADTAAWRILVGPETMRRTAEAFEANPMGALPLKGKRDAIEVFRILGPKPE